jgi:hypothetical protein
MQGAVTVSINGRRVPGGWDGFVLAFHAIEKATGQVIDTGPGSVFLQHRPTRCKFALGAVPAPARHGDRREVRVGNLLATFVGTSFAHCQRLAAA